MSWKRDEHPIVRWADFTLDHLSGIADLELATLKIHLVLEDGLRYLLAARLGVPENSFLDLRIDFSLLLELASVGVADGHLIGALRALNRARNSLAHSVAHSVESQDVQEKLAVFVREIGDLNGERVVWPTALPGRLEILRHSFGEAADAIFKLAVAREVESQVTAAPTAATWDGSLDRFRRRR